MYRLQFLSSSRLFSLLAFLALFASSAQSLCYTPDGGLSTDLPCSNAANSTCCSRNFSCTSNNLCLAPESVGEDGLSKNGMYDRGTCTDESWTSGACSQICTNGQPDSGEMVVRCEDGRFCCDADAANCCTDRSVPKFDIGNATIYAVIGRDNVRNPPAQSLQASSTSLSISSSTLTSLISAGANSSSTPAPIESKKESNGNSVAVGVGVGIPLGLLLVASIGGGLWWMQRMQSRFREREDQMRAEMRAEVMKVAEMYSMASNVHEVVGSEKDMRRMELP